MLLRSSLRNSLMATSACRSYIRVASLSGSTARGGPPASVVAAARRRQTLIDEIIRVDQAGETAAVAIYQGQIWALRKEPERTLVKHMLHGEEAHSATMDELVIKHRARPSLALPVGSACGFLLGAISGLMGSQAAMACTVAVETVIGGHYNSQIRELLARGYSTSDDEQELLAILKKHRDDELEHLNTSLENGAEQLPLYAAFTGVIKAGCTAAVEIAKRI